MNNSIIRTSSAKRYLIGSLLVAVVSAAVIAITLFANRESFVPPPLQGDTGVEPTTGPRTLLLIGSDSRSSDAEPARSDSMMLVRVDSGAASTNVLSIPRDLRVRIPGYGTAKFNEAYAAGGPKLVTKTIDANFGVKVNNVVVADFRGFRTAVDKLECFYTDIDRSYFHSNATGGDQFAEIDIKSGYQKLCGTRALDYVRFRHYDSDLFRSARQQAFLRQARQQVDFSDFVDNADAFKAIATANIRTDRWLSSGKNLQRFVRQLAQGADKPVVQISIGDLQTPTEGGISYVVATERALRRAGDRLLNTDRRANRSQSDPDDGRRETTKLAGTRNIVDATTEGQNQAVLAGFRIGLPVFYPTVKVAGASYQDGSTRPYRMENADGKRVSAYRIVAKLSNSSGDYYGIQGVNWDDPPILRNPSEQRKIGGRTYLLYYEGSKLGLVAFKRDGASYWVSNTLSRKLTEKQMLAIAKSVRLRKKGA